MLYVKSCMLYVVCCMLYVCCMLKVVCCIYVYILLKNSVIIHEENTKKNHKRVVSVYVIQIHVDLHKL